MTTVTTKFHSRMNQIKEGKQKMSEPYYYKVYADFQNKAATLLGCRVDQCSFLDESGTEFSEVHIETLFNGNYAIKTVSFYDSIVPHREYAIKLREYAGIKYVSFYHYNEILSGCLFRMIATKRGDMHKLLIRSQKAASKLEKPILEEADYNKTIGEVIRFIKNRKRIKEAGIIANKGLLIWGSPGNGKTLISSYIMQWCKERNHTVSIVTKENLLKKLYGDVLIFDDFCIDDLVKRTDVTDILLSAMDGPNKEGGRVYVFTTNELSKASELYGALIRPGRIDTVVKLDKPSKELRLKYVSSWKVKLPGDVCEKIATVTDGWSFAQLNYLHTEIVLGKLDNKDIKIQECIKLCLDKYNDFKDKSKTLGFLSSTNDNTSFFDDGAW